MPTPLPALLGLTCLLAIAPVAGAHAQEADPSRGDAGTAEPDVSLTATVRAASVTFHSPPRVHAELLGTPGREELDRTWRDNLPESVLPGRTYRDIGVRLEVGTTLDPAHFDFDATLEPVPTTDETTP